MPVPYLILYRGTTLRMYSPGHTHSAAFPDIMADGDVVGEADSEGGENSSSHQHQLHLTRPSADLFPDIPHDDPHENEGGSRPSSSTAEANTDVNTCSQRDTQDASTSDPQHTSLLSASVVPGQSKRTEYKLLLSTTALIVIDLQDYLSSAESTQNLATKDEEKNNYLYHISLPSAISNVSKLVSVLRKHRDETDQRRCGCEVIFTYLESLTNDCRDVSLDYKLSGPKLSQIPGPCNPAKFLATLQPSTSQGKGDILIPKTSCSVFTSTNIAYVLRNLQCEQLLLVGQLTDQCVESAARVAADLGFFVTVVEDACAATGMEEHSKGLSGMSGFARVMTTKQILCEIEQAAAAEARWRNASSTPLFSSSDHAKQSPGADSATEPINQHFDTTKVTKRSDLLSIKPAELWREYSPSAGTLAITALLRALKAADVQFLRYITLDAVSSIRCKAIPLSSIDKNCKSLDNRVSIAEVCFAGLPRHADVIVAATNLSAARVLVIRPDLETLRILPYASASALVFGTAHDQVTGRLSPLCTRGLLARLIETARDDFCLRFNVGAEIEFCLFKETGGGTSSSSRGPVDSSCFAHATTLNEQEEFISILCKQLSEQDIDIEQVHAESAPGQMEIVLTYQQDAMKIADNVVLARETVRECAKAHGMRALFLPKIHASAAGNGMHLHFSFSDLTAAENRFPHKSEPTLLSSHAGSFVEGILCHLPALLAITMPSLNSFRRVGKYIEACTSRMKPSGAGFKLYSSAANL